MSETLFEWVIVLMFFLLVAGLTIAEACWLSRKGWAGFGKSLGFSLITNLIGYVIGFFVAFVILGILFALIWDQSIKKLPVADRGLDAIVIATIIIAALATPVLLIMCKRIFLPILKMQNGKPAWFHSIISSAATFILAVGVPVVPAYFFYR